MSKKKNNDRQRQKRSDAKQKRRAKKRADAAKPGGVSAREAEASLKNMKLAPPPELAPALVLVAFALLPVFSVRLMPGWPAWAHLSVWLGALVVGVIIARRVAKRRPPKWDPILFFGVSALAAGLSWSQDAGALWVLNDGPGASSWQVDGGLDHRLEPRSLARLDLRSGEHRFTAKEQIVKFTVGPRERVVINLGEAPCALVGSVRRHEPMFGLTAAEPDPVICPTRASAAPAPTTGSSDATN